MATGDKIVNLDALKTTYDSTKGLVAPSEATSTAAAAHAAGSYLIYNGVLYHATKAIAAGDTLATTGAGANIAAVPGGVTGEVADLMSAINQLEDSVYEDDPTFEWEIGSIGSSGGDITSTTAIRTKTGEQIVLPVGTIISVSSAGYEFAVARYKTGVSNRSSWSSNPYTVESGYDYYRIAMRKSDQSTLDDTSISAYLSVKTYQTKFDEIVPAVNKLTEEISSIKTIIKDGSIVIGYTNFAQGKIVPDGGSAIEVNDSTRLRTGYIPVYTNDCTIVVPSGFSVLLYGYDENKNYVRRADSWATGKTSITVDEYGFIRFVVKNSAGTTIVPSDISSITIKYNYVVKPDVTKYVSTAGSDSNNGDTYSNSYATFQKAVDEGATVIIAGSGTYKGQKINIENYGNLAIRSYNGDPIILDNSDEIELAADVGTGLMKATKTFATESNWYAVFIGQTKDPVRTGTQTRTYNVILWEIGDTAKKLEPVLSLASCQGTAGTFYYDGTAVYVNPSQNSAEYRYIINEDVSLFYAKYLNRLDMSNVVFAYSDDHTAVLYEIPNVNLINCKAYRSAYGGGFRTLSANAVFTKCESYEHCSDGFGLSGGGSTVFQSCFANDNGDDGISHHADCKGIVYGGEFSNNGKGGITPAYGAVVDIYNAICHDNLYGVYFVANSDNHTDVVQNMVGCAMYDNTGADLKLEYSNVREYGCYHGNPVLDANSTLQTIGS